MGSRGGSKKRTIGVKFSFRQILASAAGAVLAAVVASVFGVKGTVVGVAIGSIAATTGTALAFQSIERTRKAVKQVVVKAPETSLLRRLGGTNAAGVAESTPGASSAPTVETVTSAAAVPDGPGQGVPAEPAVTQQMASPSEPPEPPELPDRAEFRSGNIRWPVVALAVFGVFVVSLLFVTVVELIAGRPLADLFGHGGGGTTVERIFENPPTTLPPPTTTTTTTTTTSTSTTTSTTTPSSSTTTSVGGSTTSTTTGLGSTSTTSPSSATTTSGVP